MKLFCDERILSLCEDVPLLVKDFTRSHLNDYARSEGIYEKIFLRIRMFKAGNNGWRNCHCTIGRQYFKPRIRLYERSLYYAHYDYERHGYTLEEFYRFVLLHEVYHMVDQYNNLPQYLHIYLGKEDLHISDPEKELEANFHAFNFLKARGLLHEQVTEYVIKQ